MVDFAERLKTDPELAVEGRGAEGGTARPSRHAGMDGEPVAGDEDGLARGDRRRRAASCASAIVVDDATTRPAARDRAGAAGSGSTSRSSASCYYVVDNYRSEVSALIESTIAKWDGPSTARLMELQVGRDLQFIRINGTVVGCIVGVLDPRLHAVAVAGRGHARRSPRAPGDRSALIVRLSIAATTGPPRVSTWSIAIKRRVPTRRTGTSPGTQPRPGPHRRRIRRRRSRRIWA